MCLAPIHFHGPCQICKFAPLGVDRSLVVLDLYGTSKNKEDKGETNIKPPGVDSLEQTPPASVVLVTDLYYKVRASPDQL